VLMGQPKTIHETPILVPERSPPLTRAAALHEL
jgi:hypothetical protein